eukprot:c6341_g1_i2.p1 GENE.c6341_g1_i2~~c6341_g1_i2.p1  ORF type:complete len:168 (+),score=40.27 c6341_g1_i2:357-860(+)
MGPINVLVNCAGINIDGLLLTTSDTSIHDIMTTNVIGPMLVTRAVVKDMIRARAGSIISIGSVVGEYGNAGQSVYSSSKSALVGFTRSLAKELGPKNIRVNMIAPGFIETDMTQQMAEEKRTQILSRTPLRRFGSACDVATAALFLAGDQSKFVTGHVLRVDGGVTL